MTRAILALLLCASPALADAPPFDCRALSEFKKRVESAGAWAQPLTDRELDFARGVYVMQPSTPMSLPPGDAAMWIDFHNPDGSIMVFFVDGERVCEPMSVTKSAREVFKQLDQKAGSPS